MRELKAQPSRAVLSALAVLESFDDANPSQSLSGISRRLDIPKATALRILRALEAMGYVTLNGAEGTYSLAVGVLTLAQRYLTRYEALAVARPILAQVAGETGETAHYGVLQGTEVIYLEIAESPTAGARLRGPRGPSTRALCGGRKGNTGSRRSRHR